MKNYLLKFMFILMLFVYAVKCNEILEQDTNFMVTIVKASDLKHHCHGTLLSPSHVLTTRSCVNTNEQLRITSPKQLMTEASPNNELKCIKNIMFPKNLKNNTLRNLALLVLKEPFSIPFDSMNPLLLNPKQIDIYDSNTKCQIIKHSNMHIIKRSVSVKNENLSTKNSAPSESISSSIEKAGLKYEKVNDNPLLSDASRSVKQEPSDKPVKANGKMDSKFITAKILSKIECQNEINLKNNDYSGKNAKLICTEESFCQTDYGGPLICNGHLVGVMSFCSGSCQSPYIYEEVDEMDPFLKCALKQEACSEGENNCQDVCTEKITTSLLHNEANKSNQVDRNLPLIPNSRSKKDNEKSKYKLIDSQIQIDDFGKNGFYVNSSEKAERLIQDPPTEAPESATKTSNAITLFINKNLLFTLVSMLVLMSVAYKNPN